MICYVAQINWIQELSIVPNDGEPQHREQLVFPGYYFRRLHYLAHWKHVRYPLIKRDTGLSDYDLFYISTSTHKVFNLAK